MKHRASNFGFKMRWPTRHRAMVEVWFTYDISRGGRSGWIGVSRAWGNEAQLVKCTEARCVCVIPRWASIQRRSEAQKTDAGRSLPSPDPNKGARGGQAVDGAASSPTQSLVQSAAASSHGFARGNWTGLDLENRTPQIQALDESRTIDSEKIQVYSPRLHITGILETVQ